MTIKKTLKTIILLFAIFSAFSNVVYADNTNYIESPWIYTKENDGSITITGYLGNGTECAIPWSLAGSEIKKISKNTFLNSDVKKVYIPNNGISYDYGTFSIEIEMPYYELNEYDEIVEKISQSEKQKESQNKEQLDDKSTEPEKDENVEKTSTKDEQKSSQNEIQLDGESIKIETDKNDSDDIVAYSNNIISINETEEKEASPFEEETIDYNHLESEDINVLNNDSDAKNNSFLITALACVCLIIITTIVILINKKKDSKK